MKSASDKMCKTTIPAPSNSWLLTRCASRQPSLPAPSALPAAISLLMGVFFLARFARSKKVMPGGIGAGVSLGMAAGYLAVGL
eukprot:1159210-Pelagomonas_calceolata.AAC.2